MGGRSYLDDFAGKPSEIVGVSRDHKVRSVGEAPRPYLHLPGGDGVSVSLVVRTSMPPSSALPMLRQALWSLEPEHRVY